MKYLPIGITDVFVVNFNFCCCCSCFSLMIEAMLIPIHNVVLSCVSVFGWDCVDAF